MSSDFEFTIEPEEGSCRQRRPATLARFSARAQRRDYVRFWHKADMLNALTNVRFLGHSGQ
jgi:hypothetical protein